MTPLKVAKPGIGIVGDHYTYARSEIYKYKVKLSKNTEFVSWNIYKIEFVYKSLDEHFPEVNRSYRGFDNVLWDLLDIYRLAKYKFNQTLTWVPTLYNLWYRKSIEFFMYKSTTAGTSETKRRYINQIENYKVIFAREARETLGIELATN